MTQFLKFTEVNDWEGETWHFWLQLDGNGPELKKLRVLLAKNGYATDDEDLEYELTNDKLEEEAVDVLVKQFSENDYMPEHNKVNGTFTCPEEFDEQAFYKGGITRFFVEEKKASDAVV